MQPLTLVKEFLELNLWRNIFVEILFSDLIILMQ